MGDDVQSVLGPQRQRRFEFYRMVGHTSNVGYTDTSTFCHAFKRWRGVPPSAYPRTG